MTEANTRPSMSTNHKNQSGRNEKKWGMGPWGPRSASKQHISTLSNCDYYAKRVPLKQHTTRNCVFAKSLTIAAQLCCRARRKRRKRVLSLGGKSHGHVTTRPHHKVAIPGHLTCEICSLWVLKISTKNLKNSI